MEPVAAKIVTEMFLLVLSVIASPVDLKEFRLDLVDPPSRVESLVVQRTDTGFTLLQQKDDKLVEIGAIRPVAGNPAAFTVKFDRDDGQTIDFSANITDFSVEKLQKARSLDLRAKDGVVVHVRRSGNAVYLMPSRGRETYVCH